MLKSELNKLSASITVKFKQFSTVQSEKMDIWQTAAKIDKLGLFQDNLLHLVVTSFRAFSVFGFVLYSKNNNRPKHIDIIT